MNVRKSPSDFRVELGVTQKDLKSPTNATLLKGLGCGLAFQVRFRVKALAFMLDAAIERKGRSNHFFFAMPKIQAPL